MNVPFEWLTAPLQQIVDLMAKNPLNVSGLDLYTCLIASFGFLLMGVAISIQSRRQTYFGTILMDSQSRQFAYIASLGCAGFSLITTMVVGSGDTSLVASTIIITSSTLIVLTASYLVFAAGLAYKHQRKLLQLIERETFGLLTLLVAYAPIMVIMQATPSSSTAMWLLDRLTLVMQCLILAWLPLMVLQIAIHVIRQRRSSNNQTTKASID